ALGSALLPRALEHAGGEVERGDARSLARQAQRVPAGPRAQVEHLEAAHVAEELDHARLLQRDQRVVLAVVDLRPAVVALARRQHGARALLHLVARAHTARSSAATRSGTWLAGVEHRATRNAPPSGTTYTPSSRMARAARCASAVNTATKKPPS